MFATTDGKTDPDEVPDVPETPVTKLGDVWLLGDHRIVCGDSTDAATVGMCLNGEKPHLMVTDPPYGVEYDASWREKAGINMSTAAIGKVMNDDNPDWTAAWALFPGDVAYVWHAGLVGASLEATGFSIKSQIVWAKQQMVISRGDYHWQHEPCWYVVKKGGNGHWCGGRDKTTVWNIKAREDKGHGHSTQKPVECMKRPIENNSKPSDRVYEPFSDSGTTIIAGEMTGRKVHSVELSPAYVDVAVKRWQEFTGKTATRESDGLTFAEASERTHVS